MKKLRIGFLLPHYSRQSKSHCGVDIIENEGRPYVVDISSMPGFKRVPDAATHLAAYLHQAAGRAAHARASVESGTFTRPAGEEGVAWA